LHGMYINFLRKSKTQPPQGAGYIKS